MEEAAGSPLVKLISFGAGLRQGVSKAGKGRGKGTGGGRSGKRSGKRR